MLNVEQARCCNDTAFVAMTKEIGHATHKKAEGTAFRFFQMLE
jgi:hypothetical protein